MSLADAVSTPRKYIPVSGLSPAQGHGTGSPRSDADVCMHASSASDPVPTRSSDPHSPVSSLPASCSPRTDRKIFLLPCEKHGKAFVAEQARLFNAVGSAAALECVALKAALVMPALLLQESSASSKTKDHNECLSRRLVLWREGRFAELVAEVNTIQQHWVAQTQRKSHSDSEDRLASRFSSLVSAGRVRAAIRLLSQAGPGTPLDLNATVPGGEPASFSRSVRDVLLEKYPPARRAAAHAVLPLGDSDPSSPRPVLFDSIDGNAIRRAALRTEGAASLTGIDTSGWRRLCCSFGGASSDLCNALAISARRFCTGLLDPSL